MSKNNHVPLNKYLQFLINRIELGKSEDRIRMICSKSSDNFEEKNRWINAKNDHNSGSSNI